jgi:hypothetical protein
VFVSQSLRNYNSIPAAFEKQTRRARDIADGIERGELPVLPEDRQFVALIMRNWANREMPKKPARRGNPKFERKIYDPFRVALMVAFEIGFGKEEHDAIASIAEEIGVEWDTVRKIFRARRKHIAANWFANTNLAHRVGAIRGEWRLALPPRYPHHSPRLTARCI